jgi:7,8-dihydropterin-6-yl-methyl-4-(beta-D-ribofuranosyl)aminobenzene 5'-phosphate synthase
MELPQCTRGGMPGSFALLLAAATFAGCAGRTAGQRGGPPAAGDGIAIIYDAISARPLDSAPDSGDPALDWGYSALIRRSDRDILFDAGNDLEVFRRNVAALGVDLGAVDLAVVSHNHNDHTAGIGHLVRVNPDVALFVPADPWLGRRPGERTPLNVESAAAPGSDPGDLYWRGEAPPRRGWGARWPEARWEPVGESREAARGIHVVATSAARWGYFDIDPAGKRTDHPLPELTLVIETREGLVLVTGCSHSGILTIVEAVERHLPGRPIRLVAGGLHLLDQDETAVRAIATTLRERHRVETIAPGHCTGEVGFRVFREVFGEDCLYAGLGSWIPLDGDERAR